MSVVVGGSKCNAQCPYCVSKMTPRIDDGKREPEINVRNFHKACQFARDSGVSTVLLTGKGEPTLYPDDITTFLGEMKEGKHDFPFIELQTNGIVFRDGFDVGLLKLWYDFGLNTICLSVVHWDDDENRKIFQPSNKKPNAWKEKDIPTLVRKLHNIGFSVRLSVVLIKGFIDTPDKVGSMIDFCKKYEVEQLTFRPVRCPPDCDNDISRWVGKNHIYSSVEIEKWLELHGTLLMNLFHCAKVYDVDGQNVCFTDSLTHRSDPNEMRQLIYHPNGRIMYDWTHKGAVLL